MTTTRELVKKFFDMVDNITIIVRSLNDELRGTYIFETIHGDTIRGEEVRENLEAALVAIEQSGYEEEIVCCVTVMRDIYNLDTYKTETGFRLEIEVFL